MTFKKTNEIHHILSCNQLQHLDDLFQNMPSFEDVYNCTRCGYTKTCEVNHAKISRHGQKDLEKDIIFVCKWS